MKSLSPSPETDDIVQFGEPKHGKRFFAFENELPQCGGANRDFTVRPRWFDKNNTAPDFNIWRRFSEIAFSWLHFVTLPALKYTEQLGNRQRLLAEINPNLSKVNGFRRTATFQRPTAFERPHDNDNFDPLEAA